ncbi:hypothetical protein [uncultured Pseudacidovorax sp.]|uniref:hypothetical protein n=1 Tax=uncultured Pseudacidovorax sp. TaxID=679313 RepID=UPI0025CDA5BE|nr:hypothetical protein [uncultured Pseudacidovorax sp.]
MNRRSQAISLLQATEDSPALSGLMSRVRDSQLRLKAIQPLIPPAMFSGLQAGPVEHGSWCLIVRGNAVAAKLRQMTPMLQAHLRSKGWETTAIRIKISSAGS